MLPVNQTGKHFFIIYSERQNKFDFHYNYFILPCTSVPCGHSVHIGTGERKNIFFVHYNFNYIIQDLKIQCKKENRNKTFRLSYITFQILLDNIFRVHYNYIECKNKFDFHCNFLYITLRIR